MSMSKSMIAPGEDPPVLVSVTISSGESLSSAGNLTPPNATGAYKIVGFALPAAFTKAHIQFQVSWDGSNFFEIFDFARYTADTPYRYQDADADPQSLGTKWWTIVNSGQAGGVIVTGGINFLKAQWIKVRSGTAESPVNQDADRIINIITMPHAATLQY
jgi:hypothetical protein